MLDFEIVKENLGINNKAPGNKTEKEEEEIFNKEGILEVISNQTMRVGFIRCKNYLPGDEDVYLSASQLNRFNLKTGDKIVCTYRHHQQYSRDGVPTKVTNNAVQIISINDIPSKKFPSTRRDFKDLTPIYPNEKIKLETTKDIISTRMIDLLSPIGKGQRGMIVAQPKVGKTTLLKEVANAIASNHKDIHIIVLLIDERPEEVTDIQDSIVGDNVDIIYSTFDEGAENHKRVAEMTIERAKRIAELGGDVVILLDSITRLARAYNLTETPSGRTLSGGLDPNSLHGPRKILGAARNLKEGGSLTIISTALIDTGSKMDDIVFEELKGTGNMELVLDRSLADRRVFPAVNITKSSTRNEDKLLTSKEILVATEIRRVMADIDSNGVHTSDIVNLMNKTKTNDEFLEFLLKKGLTKN